jgi:hypothetical protein
MSWAEAGNDTWDWMVDDATRDAAADWSSTSGRLRAEAEVFRPQGAAGSSEPWVETCCVQNVGYPHYSEHLDREQDSDDEQIDTYATPGKVMPCRGERECVLGSQRHDDQYLWKVGQDPPGLLQGIRQWSNVHEALRLGGKRHYEEPSEKKAVPAHRWQDGSRGHGSQDYPQTRGDEEILEVQGRSDSHLTPGIVTLEGASFSDRGGVMPGFKPKSAARLRQELRLEKRLEEQEVKKKGEADGKSGTCFECHFNDSER